MLIKIIFLIVRRKMEENRFNICIDKGVFQFGLGLVYGV